MSGFDPEAIFDAVAALFDADVFGINVYAFVPSSPDFPAMGLFPAADFINYFDSIDGFGTITFELRTAFTFGAEDSLRALYRLLAKGAGHDRSLTNVLQANRTLDGLVHDIFPVGASVRAFGDENAGLYEGVITVRAMVDFEEV